MIDRIIPTMHRDIHIVRKINEIIEKLNEQEKLDESYLEMPNVR